LTTFFVIRRIACATIGGQLPSRDDAERLALMLPGSDAPIAPTHWSFGQLASLVGAPAAYLRQLPAPLAGINLQYGLTSHRTEQVKTLEIEEGRVELRAVTGPDYGRIFDHELVSAAQRTLRSPSIWPRAPRIDTCANAGCGSHVNLITQ
jgi:hypothetical protein